MHPKDFPTLRFLAVATAAVLSMLAGCANPAITLGRSQTFESWKHQKIGTSKEFTGTFDCGGRTFPVRIVQRLKSVQPTNIVLENEYYLSGFHVKTEGCGLLLPDFSGMTVFSQYARDLSAGVPPPAETKKVLFSGKYLSAVPPASLTFTPNHRSFGVDGKRIVANLYEFDQPATGFHRRENIKVWFSPEIPGGWVAMENEGGWAASDPNAEAFKSWLTRGKADASSVFIYANRRSLALKSVRIP